jgi:multidrug efflux pump subunit AcrA (membrane-fusion protein)
MPSGLDRSLMARTASRVLLWAVGAAAVLAVGGLAGASLIKSPAEVAASIKPPPPATLTAPVVREKLQATVSLRGTVRVSGETQITPSSEIGAVSLVITAIDTSLGAHVHDGEVVLAVSGRPLYVLPGAFPAYRDMVPGDEGPDVDELQSALQGLGYSTSPDAPGVFGKGTEAAVAAFYQSIGYPVPRVAGNPHGASMVPMAEVAFVPRLPATVIALNGRVGSVVAPPLITLASSGLQVAGELPLDERALVRPGKAVVISDALTGFSGTGTISSVGLVAEGAASGTPYLPVIVRTAHMPISELGADVQITVTSASTAGPVLAVPEAAIATDAAGATYVQVREPGGGLRQVRVHTGVTSGGMVAVIPTLGSLAVGDQVVTGQ